MTGLIVWNPDYVQLHALNCWKFHSGISHLCLILAIYGHHYRLYRDYPPASLQTVDENEISMQNLEDLPYKSLEELNDNLCRTCNGSGYKRGI